MGCTPPTSASPVIVNCNPTEALAPTVHDTVIDVAPVVVMVPVPANGDCDVVAFPRPGVKVKMNPPNPAVLMPVIVRTCGSPPNWKFCPTTRFEALATSTLPGVFSEWVPAITG